MARKSAFLPAVLALGAVAVIAASVLAARLVDGPAAPAAAESSGITGVGGPFTLQDGSGRTVQDSDFRGHWMLIYFGYTHCPDACPTTLSNITQALQDLGAQATMVQPIFITVDPARDDARTMKEYAAAFDPRLIGLTGTDDEVAAAARVYRVYYAKHMEADGKDYSMDHSSIVYAVNPVGKTVGFFTQETPAEKMAAQLKSWIGPAKSS